MNWKWEADYTGVPALGPLTVRQHRWWFIRRLTLRQGGQDILSFYSFTREGAQRLAHRMLRGSW